MPTSIVTYDKEYNERRSGTIIKQQNPFRPGLRPGPTGGAYDTPQRPRPPSRLWRGKAPPDSLPPRRLRRLGLFVAPNFRSVVAPLSEWVCRFLTAHRHIKAIQCHTMVKSLWWLAFNKNGTLLRFPAAFQILFISHIAKSAGHTARRH